MLEASSGTIPSLSARVLANPASELPPPHITSSSLIVASLWVLLHFSILACAQTPTTIKFCVLFASLFPANCFLEELHDR